MRWKPLEDRHAPGWLAAVLAVPALIIVSPLIICLWFDQAYQKRFGPTAEWTRWFAWYPVRADRGFGQSVWLETVERRSWYGHTEHRTLDEASPPRNTKDRADG